MKILIDTNILRRAVTHVTEMIPQTVKWGPHDVTRNVAQRTPRPPRIDENDIREDLACLATLCTSAREGRLEFFTAFELQMEELRQEYPHEGYLGINLFRGVPLKTVPCPIQRSIVIGSAASASITKKEQRDFFRSIQNPRFLEINNATDKAHIADVFHLWTAEEASLDVFLTMDYRFRNVVNQKNKIVKSRTAVMTPKELCEHLRLESSDIEKLAADINPFS